MSDYQQRLAAIEAVFCRFYDKVFLTEHEEFLENQKNKALLGEMMATIHRDPKLSNVTKTELLSECLDLLAHHTGCQEDEEIANAMIEKLPFLKGDLLSQFLQKQSTNRWR